MDYSDSFKNTILWHGVNYDTIHTISGNELIQLSYSGFDNSNIVVLYYDQYNKRIECLEELLAYFKNL